MRLSDATVKIIFDSRRQETLTAELFSENFSACASIPSGKSRSSFEAFVLAPHRAVEIFNKEVKSELLSKDFLFQEDFDNFLIKLDGTNNKSRLGGNLILSLSLAFARLKAKAEGLELFDYINKLYRGSLHYLPPSFIPKPIFNVINGGAHAKNKLEFQEFQIIPQHSSFKDGFEAARKFYKELGENLNKEFGKEEISLGDEGGYSTPFRSNDEAFQELKQISSKFFWRTGSFSFHLSCDAAANSFFIKSENKYKINEEKFSPEELYLYHEHLIHKYSLIALEDPFCENAFSDFSKINKQKGVYIIADDLTSTNPSRLKMAINSASADALIIKPNQIGSLSETLEVARLAHKSGWQLIVSHRSGETEDDFIADLAVGLSAWGIKAGAPATPERLSKYHRLLEIEKIISRL
ncbi:MAG: hypothetical protein A2604_02440 [Candidatus Liptonbacteria bacterium RIFOXYD1_FULL_36_11]|uniref:Enolase n=1 Tax=Candidatus Liptonbacteria bacterium RIFOXYD1_FULL_36_11 TaxID=1798656 RepID=A0A1G2CUN7_9BACT|nr:MAG: hypothetical protein A2604_02440 [Candidatus Liptonbacteria bacterium RIFOXYD1_FULL_36_11]